MPEPTEEDELLRLVGEYGNAMHDLGETDDTAAPHGQDRQEMGRRAEARRDALLSYIDSPHSIYI